MSPPRSNVLIIRDFGARFYSHDTGRCHDLDVIDCIPRRSVGYGSPWVDAAAADRAGFAEAGRSAMGRMDVAGGSGYIALIYQCDCHRSFVIWKKVGLVRN